jgi:hypothetical protein
VSSDELRTLRQEGIPVAVFPVVLTVEAAAQRLVTTPEKLLAELEAGRLEGFRIGDEWRTTEAALLKFMGVCAPPPQERSDPMIAAPKKTARQSVDFASLLVDAEWRRVDLFEYQWPKKKTEPDKPPESYEEAYATRVTLAKREVPLLIGFCNRESAGDKDRRRAVVFLGYHPSLHPSKSRLGGWRPPGLHDVVLMGRLPSLYPLVEFSGENSEAFAVTGRMASVIKLPSGEHLRPGDPIPPEYADFPLTTYNQLVVGPYAAASLAVMAHKDDLSLMAHHGLIRARERKLI